MGTIDESMAGTDGATADNAITYNTTDYNNDLIYDTNLSGNNPAIDLMSSNNAGPSIAHDAIPVEELLLEEVVSSGPGTQLQFARKANQPHKIIKPADTQRAIYGTTVKRLPMAKVAQSQVPNNVPATANTILRGTMPGKSLLDAQKLKAAKQLQFNQQQQVNAKCIQ